LGPRENLTENKKNSLTVSAQPGCHPAKRRVLVLGHDGEKREAANIIRSRLIRKEVCIPEHQTGPVTIVRLRAVLLHPPDRKYSLEAGQNASRYGNVLPLGDRPVKVNANA
jgi:hypothetical protein